MSRKKKEVIEEKVLTQEDEKLLKKIARKNRIPIAEDILLGMNDTDLYEKYDYYSVEEMKREIAKLKGKPWVCKTCLA